VGNESREGPGLDTEETRLFDAAYDTDYFRDCEPEDGDRLLVVCTETEGAGTLQAEVSDEVEEEGSRVI
jgi:hypothetical protein